MDPDEIQGLKHKHVTTRSELDELEQANLEQGLAWVTKRRSRSGDTFDDQFIRILHERLFGAVWTWAGKYRLTEKNIGTDPLQIAIEVRTFLDDARFWVEHNVFPPLEVAARFHHRLVQIHPFPNGNGRHARIAADTLLLEVYRHPPIDWADGHDLQTDNQRRTAYIVALRNADRGNYDQLLNFVGAAPAAE